MLSNVARFLVSMLARRNRRNRRTMSCTGSLTYFKQAAKKSKTDDVTVKLAAEVRLEIKRFIQAGFPKFHSKKKVMKKNSNSDFIGLMNAITRRKCVTDLINFHVGTLLRNLVNLQPAKHASGGHYFYFLSRFRRRCLV